MNTKLPTLPKLAAIRLPGSLARAGVGFFFMNTKEEWRAVVGWEGFYEVSNFGRVRSNTRTVAHSFSGTITRRRQFLTQKPNNSGYPTCGLCRDGKVILYGIHRLVFEIRKLLGVHTQNEIAAMFGVSASAISGISTGRNWYHI